MQSVIAMQPRQKPAPPHDAALKRLAIQIAAQLPEEEEDALAVLEHAKTLVRSFLGQPRPV
jgi:hypothetical protein